jgi:hypothetical protein
MSGLAKVHVIRDGEEVYLIDPHMRRSLVRLAGYRAAREGNDEL